MFHDRAWKVTEIATPEELAYKLTQQTWSLCNGFVVAGHPDYLFLNDSTSADGAAEFGVVKGGLDAEERVQIESITFSWCTEKKALSYIRRILAGKLGGLHEPVTLRIASAEQHGSCGFCT